MNLQGGAGDPERTIVDPDKTLVAPRFDAREASTAQPVVPLAESPVARRERRPGALPLVLILISALVGGLVSVFAYRLYQQRGQTSARAERQQPSAGESPAPTQQQQLKVTPELSAEAAVTESPEATPESITESAPTNSEIAEVREEEAGPVEESPARLEAREDRAGRDLEAARERTARAEKPAARDAPEGERVAKPRARRVEESTAPTRDMGVRAQRRDERVARDDEAPTRPRANRRAASRERPQPNIDRVRAIFEGSPPAP